MRLFAIVVVLAMLAAACGDASAPDSGDTVAAVPAAPGPGETTAADTIDGDGPVEGEAGGPPPSTVDPVDDTTAPEDDTRVADDEPGLTPVPGAVEVHPITPGGDSPGIVEPALEPLVAVARADLAQRLGVAEAEIATMAAQALVWPDTSLGCPQPDMAYLQVLTDGYQIVLSHDGAIYPYHGGGSRGPFLCEK